MEQEIIAPIPVEVIKSELTDDKRLRFSTRGNNEIYCFTAKEAPNTMREIGRLREITFRAAGGGTGLDCDIDEYDTMENPCHQLVVWNPEAEEIIGGYRYILGPDIQLDENGQPRLATSHLFNFSENFIKNYMPYTIELGRSFVTLDYQSSKAGAKAIFALDNLWDGLGALAVIMPNCKYYFGKMTMYPSYNRLGRDMILYFLKKHFDDKEGLLIPKNPLLLEHSKEELAKIFTEDDLKADFKILNSQVRSLGLCIPPLVNAYMGLSPTMKVFGTAINDDFGDVEETGILITIDEMHNEKRIRYIESFAKEHPELIKITSGANKVFYEPSDKSELQRPIEL